MTHDLPTRIGPLEPRQPPVHQGNIHFWDLSYYGWVDQDERAEFWQWAFGPFNEETETVEAIQFLLGRPSPSNFAGDEDEFLLVEGPLSNEEYLLIERYVEYCWHILPIYLKDRRSRPVRPEERAFHRRQLVI